MDNCPMHSTITCVLSSVAWFHHSKNLKSALLPDSRGLRVCHFVPLSSSVAMATIFFTKCVLAAITHKLRICHFDSYRKMGYICMILHCGSKSLENYFLKFSFQNVLFSNAGNFWQSSAIAAFTMGCLGARNTWAIAQVFLRLSYKFRLLLFAPFLSRAF